LKPFLLAFLAAIAVFGLLYFFLIVRMAPKSKLQSRLRSLERTDSDLQRAQIPMNLTDISFRERVLLPFWQAIERRIVQIAPREMKGMFEHKIMLAGRQHVWRVEVFLCIWILFLAGGIVLAWLFVWKHELVFVQSVMCLLLGAGLGAAMPISFLNLMIQQRQGKMRRQLPEVMDLLCVSVQAGLSFDAALRKIVERMKGPFIEECARMLRDVRMGMLRYTAMQNLARRCELEDVHLFVTAIVQAERLGTSIGNTLAIQADNMRERRRQQIKAEAMKAPVKIVFPMVLFIFPAMFVVLLLPVLLSMYKSFTNM